MNDIDWKIQIFALISVCYTIFKIITYFLSEKEIELTGYKKIILIWIVIIGVVWPYWNHIKSTSIKDGGLYYVNLFETLDSQKNYRVPAFIYTDEDGYHLNTVYWSNGGELSFDSGYDDLVIGKKVLMVDDQSKEWYIELTNEKAEMIK